MAFNRLPGEAVFRECKNQIPGPGVARKKKRFSTGLRAGITKAALAPFEIYARISPRPSLQDVGLTRLDAGVATQTMCEKIGCFSGPRRKNPIAGVAPTAGQHASTG
ncbi:hypothetical protein CFSAN004345_21870 [Salmonella enterica subsp. enterica serovar Typhimurium var. 5- str. CFSAN004345]|nr:hypothetical protein CFSAN000658_19785 [Salmonella enterica subsp. enterica serovar Abaetetuba str. ATCC 35640]ETB93497.1 hypothetical protein CFSAN004345_21870 [Salmonella enterica subsp. enterica serovar Typhimurium var. 5- str. CFSAN004345]ETC68974.1 hypothetical protein SEEE3402_13440 [Salmonella enterica subsp. enterica serovar Enteritidis str. 3402]